MNKSTVIALLALGAVAVGLAIYRLPMMPL